jgi:uncharacterized LabA/DUF88 family protein
MKVAYIDASNLKFGVEQSGWELDYKKFRGWLRDKFGVTHAKIFLGLRPELGSMYNMFQKFGYQVLFKPTVVSAEGKVKGNIDGELILQIARDYYEDGVVGVVLVSGDGDYHCAVEFLKEKDVPVSIVSPNKKYLSLLLRRTQVPVIILDDSKHKLCRDMKRPPDTP